MPFEWVAQVSDIWEGEMVGRCIAGKKILLVRLEGSFHAYHDRCAHLGYPLSKGRLDGRVLTCHAHEWQYDAVTGRGINPASAHLTRLPVCVQGSDILVDAESIHHAQRSR